MPSIGKTLATISLAFVVAAAPAYVVNQDMSAEFERGAISQVSDLQSNIDMNICDAACINDFAEAGSVVIDFFENKRSKTSGKKEDKGSAFDVDPVRDGERLLERPAYIGYLSSEVSGGTLIVDQSGQDMRVVFEV